MLKKNANVNAKARCGATALHFASETGKLGVVNILIEQGHADINIANEHGVTALLAAADRQGIKQHLYKIKTRLFVYITMKIIHNSHQIVCNP